MIDITTSSFFVSYVTASEFSENIPVSSINDMVSYNFVPPTNTTFEYNVGAENRFENNFRIKNMTINTPLVAQFSSSAHFLFSTASFESASILTTTLLPAEEKVVTIYSNNLVFDDDVQKTNATGSFVLTISNNTGPQALRNVTASLLISQQYPSSITIT